jgi:hypothetical protein
MEDGQPGVHGARVTKPVELDSRIEHVLVLHQHQLTVEQTVLVAAPERKRATPSNASQASKTQDEHSFDK